MDFKNVLSKKNRTEAKISRGEYVFNEDNVVRMKEFKGKSPNVIEVSTAARIVNIVTATVSIVALIAIVIGVWWVLNEVGFIESFKESLDLSSFDNSGGESVPEETPEPSTT